MLITFKSVHQMRKIMLQIYIQHTHMYVYTQYA